MRLTRSWDPRGTGAAGPSSELGTALVALAGILPAGLGAMALAGWYGHDLVLLRVDEGWSPIVYNEALDLALVGLALLALAAGWRRWALPAAVYAIAVGALSCAEAVTGRSLGIDQLFMHAWVAASGHAPGRMAPNAALGSVLAGTALVVASRGPGPRRAAVVGSAGALVLAIGSVGVFGYAAGVPSAYGWGHLTALAFVAAVGLMVVGAGLVGAAWWFLEPGGTRAGWVLAPMAAGVLSLVLVAWSVVVQLTGATPRGSVAATTAGATVVVGLVVGGLASLSLSLFGRLNASEERFRSTFDRSPVGLALASLEPGAWLRFQRVNHALCELTGFDTRALLEMALGDLAGPGDTGAGRGDDDHSGPAVGIPAPPAPGVEDSWVRCYVRADGGMFWARVSVTELPGDPRQALVHIDDVTATKRTEEDLSQRALHDQLTGLANRNLAMDHLRLSLQQLTRKRASAAAVAVLYLDLDHFKRINDTLGHEAGDDTLRQVGARLAGAVRAPDTAARLGGDEFLIICTLTDEAGVRRIVERAQASLAQPLLVGDKPLQVSASIGVATARQASTDPAALLRQADTALYEAKHKGRNRWEMYDETLHHRAFEREAIEVDLRSAAASGLFRLYYQPIFDVHDGRVLGAEALLRLAHPTRGLLEPGAFIRVAEDSDLIGRIGDWVLKQACLQLAQWNPGGAFRVGVNVSRRELSDRGFANRVLGAAGDAGINPAALSLEMTEGTLIEGGTPIVNELRRLSGAGVGLAVDDFGTGYCSLSYLQRFPIDTVKIDGSVVAGLGVSRHGSAIVEAVTALSHTLDLAAVAEGVETPEQLEALRNLGCPRAQGFLLGRPVPPLEFAPLLASRDSHARAATPDLRAGADTYVHQGRPL